MLSPARDRRALSLYHTFARRKLFVSRRQADRLAAAGLIIAELLNIDVMGPFCYLSDSLEVILPTHESQMRVPVRLRRLGFSG